MYRNITRNMLFTISLSTLKHFTSYHVFLNTLEQCPWDLRATLRSGFYYPGSVHNNQPLLRHHSSKPANLPKLPPLSTSSLRGVEGDLPKRGNVTSGQPTKDRPKTKNTPALLAEWCLSYDVIFTLFDVILHLPVTIWLFDHWRRWWLYIL